MVLRQPGETGPGPWYRLFREGELRGIPAGERIRSLDFEIEKPRDGNLNRNFPAGWRPEFRQYGAGDYPLGEPESRAVADFLLAHPNIRRACSATTRTAACICGPRWVAPDDSLPRLDLALYNSVGAMGTALTGYPLISVYEEFTTDPDMPRVGSLMQWSYDEMGILTFSTELWNPELAAASRSRRSIRCARPLNRGRAAAAALQRRASGRRGLRGLDALRSSAAGAAGDWRLDAHVHLPQSATGFPGE